MSQTNETTKKILNFLFERQVFAWRNSVGAFRTEHGYYQMGKAGSPDIMAILPPLGKFLGIEIKTGKDSLRDEQIGFIKNTERMGAQVLVVKDFEDFEKQWTKILTEKVSVTS